MLTISVAAASRALLTAAELRTAAGLGATDTSRDTELAAIGLTVADTICDWCNIAGDGLAQVTLLRETLVETFRLRRGNLFHEHRLHRHYHTGSGSLILSRRFLGTVDVLEDDVAVDAADFLIDVGAGLLTRLRDDHVSSWAADKIVVTYQAGFVAIPRPLASVAAEMVARKTGAGRDLATTMERVEANGVELVERRFWTDAATAAEISSDLALRLAPYQTVTVG